MTTEEDIKKAGGIPPINTVLIHLAPVILSNKPACLLNYSAWRIGDIHLDPNGRQENIIKSVSGWFPPSSGMGSLQFQDRNLVMIFQRRRLSEYIFRHENYTFLQTLGYHSRFHLETQLDLLQKRFVNSFPHEIGIFLGIPAADVRSFIQHRGKNYIFNQYWKVYHHPDRARALFNTYDRAKIKMAAIIKRLSLSKSDSSF